MPSTREIRQRIKSIKNIAKITKAMQMVATSKMRRAQERVEQARPYAEQLRELVSRLARISGDNDPDLVSELTLLKERPVRHIGIVLVSPDRGLSGALPSNVNRMAATTAQELLKRYSEPGKNAQISYIGVGRKGRDFIVRTQQNLLAEFTNYGDRPSINDASAIAQVAVDAFLSQEVDIVYVVYPKFINTVTQQPVAIQLLPVQPPAEEATGAEASPTRNTVDYLYEPNPGEIFKALLPRYVDILVYQALLETVSSQLSAQMIAMKNATDSANELLGDLTLTYNKARQAAITMQILEVVSGAEAL
jgi:F-type H+-transporting ATPase subunit gamma